MSTSTRWVCLFLLSPTIAFAHGTEIGGLLLGSFGAILLMIIASAFLPFRPGRKNTFVRIVFGSLALVWVLALAGLGEWLQRNIRQRVAPWVLCAGAPPLLVGGIFYCAFGRPLSREKKPKA